MGGTPSAGSIVTEYRLGIHFGVCHGPVDAVTGIYIGDKLVHATEIFEGTVALADPNAFGGVEKEGGIRGKAIILSGKDDQLLPADAAQRLGGTPTTLPGFRGLLSVFFKGFDGEKAGFYWSANSPYIKNPSIRVRRSPKGFYPEKAMIGPDANPAHIIYECLTNSDWGMGGDPDSIDLDELRHGADTLYAEGLGLSLMWTGQSKIESFVQEVLDHIEATFFLHPRTGKLTLKLIRQDFDLETLFHVNESNAVMRDFQRKGWGETTNEINASWTNPENEQEENVTVHSLGNIAAQGSVSSDSRNYYGARTSELALRLATRDINVAAYPIASCEVEMDRSAWDQVPGSVVKVTWPRHGLFELPMRVGQINYGRRDRSRIVINLVEDVFALPATSYVEAPDTEWTDPTSPPEPLAFSQIANAPYFMVSRIVGDAQASTVPYPQQYLFALAAQDNTDTVAAEMWSERTDIAGNTEFQKINTISLSSHATLVDPIPREAHTVIDEVANFWGNVVPASGTLVLFGSGDDDQTEWGVVEAVAGSVTTIRRGILDTVPRAWPAATPIWLFLPSATIYDSGPHAAGELVPYKLRSRTTGGLLPLEDTPEIEATTSDRMHLPLRPANVRINDVLFGPASMNTAQMTGMSIEWSNRNRLLETSQILGWDEAGISPEAGQTTTIIIRDLAGNVRETVTDIVGESHTTTFNPATVLGGGITVEVFSVRDDLESFQRFSTQIAKT